MQKISGKEKCLSDLLINKKYTIHYYQREYRWGKKQIEELINDLTDEFLEKYDPEYPREEIEKYGHYFLGSIVLSSGENQNAIIDGQQRLSSLTLLLIFLNNLQKHRTDKVAIDNLIFSERHGRRSFNISVEDRESCLNALYTGQFFDPSNSNESVKTIYERYHDIEELFPEDLKKDALPYFIDWLIYNVDLVEILAYTEQDAHKIFVSMNDRGLSLTPTEMLKGFLLSEIASDSRRNQANEIWKTEILKLNEIDKEKEDANFFKNWLRASYAETIRETKKDAENKDFDIIGKPFHKWVRDNTKKIGLYRSADFDKFVIELLPKYAGIYRDLKKYSNLFIDEYPCVFYNADRNFTLQYQVILACIDCADDADTIKKKIQITSRFLDQYIVRRVFNYKTVDYSTIKNAMFSLSKKIRRKTVSELKPILENELMNMEQTLDGVERFRLNQFTGRYMLHILSRLTHFIESKSGLNTRFADYVDRNIRNPFDIEHIWADKYERFSTVFHTEEDFQSYRNKFGALLLLPQDKNRSFLANTYSEKLPMYFGENLLAKTLHENCYQNNPQFLRFKNEFNLSFTAYSDFGNNSIDQRQTLYKSIATLIWDCDLEDGG